MGNKGNQVYENQKNDTSEPSFDRKGAIMSPEQIEFLNQRHLPHRLTAQETGWLLGFSVYDITVLTARRMLKPVGQPAQNSTKYYSTAQIQRLWGNFKWMDRATALLNRHWKEKNAKRKSERKKS